MNALAIVFFACLAAFAEPSAIWAGHGHAVNVVPAGPTILIGASGVVGPNGASGPSGIVTGHGAIGPSGEHNAPAHHSAIYAAPAIVQHSAIVAPDVHGALIAPAAHGLLGVHGYGLGHGAYWQ